MIPLITNQYLPPYLTLPHLVKLVPGSSYSTSLPVPVRVTDQHKAISPRISKIRSSMTAGNAQSSEMLHNNIPEIPSICSGPTTGEIYTIIDPRHIEHSFHSTRLSLSQSFCAISQSPVRRCDMLCDLPKETPPAIGDIRTHTTLRPTTYVGLWETRHC